MGTKIVTLIPARGGSKGVPMKNVQMVGEKSLIARSVGTARAALPSVPCVVVTDCSAIGQQAEGAGAAVCDLPAQLAQDNSPSEDALTYALENLYALGLGYEPMEIPDIVVFLQCTSPFTTQGDVRGTLKVVQDEGFDSALTVTPFHGFLWREDGTGITHNAGVMRLQRHRYEAKLLETGAVYAFRGPLFMQTHNRFCGKTGVYVSTTPRFEIDEPLDLIKAQQLAGIYGRDT